MYNYTAFTVNNMYKRLFIYLFIYKRLVVKVCVDETIQRTKHIGTLM